MSKGIFPHMRKFR